MKTSIYIEDGISQLVLTPETEFERKALDGVVLNEARQAMQTELFYREFYHCQGGHFMARDTGKPSLIVRISPAPKGEYVP